MEIEIRITDKLGTADHARIKEFIDIASTHRCRHLFRCMMGGIPYWLAPTGSFVARLSFNRPHVEETVVKEAQALLEKKFKVIETSTVISPQDIHGKMEEIERVIRREVFMTCSACRHTIDFTEHCPYCGAKADENLTYCGVCQLAFVPSYKHCPDCGKELSRVDGTIWDYDVPADHFFDGVSIAPPDGPASVDDAAGDP
ncbi:MAG: hypothetical protein A2040_08915 [Rhodocyclales bacterium GWA2_65_19]|nr:MAG: hypothetical protein A2040_08915 [Rhodocyclales bacterium GWA2_65_19]